MEQEILGALAQFRNKNHTFDEGYVAAIQLLTHSYTFTQLNTIKKDIQQRELRNTKDFFKELAESYSKNSEGMTKEEYLQESIRNLSGFSFADMINLSKEEFYKALESRKGPKRVVSASTTPLDSDSSDDESPKPSSSSGKRSYSYDHLFSRHDLSSKLDIRPKCKFGNTCNQLYDEKHMKEFSHPFLPPCCFKNSCSEYGDEAHKFSHPCRYGSQCRELKDPHHTQYYSHAERKVCEHDKECLCIHDRDHMLRVKHTGALDFRHECKYGLLCKDDSREHHLKYAHPSTLGIPTNFYGTLRNLI